MTNDECELERLKIASQLYQCYITRPKETPIRDDEWNTMKAICQYLEKNFK